LTFFHGIGADLGKILGAGLYPLCTLFEAQRADSGDRVLGERQLAPFPPAREYGERCKLPKRGLGESLSQN